MMGMGQRWKSEDRDGRVRTEKSRGGGRREKKKKRSEIKVK